MEFEAMYYREQQHRLLLISRYPPRNVWVYDLQRKIMRRQTFEADQSTRSGEPTPGTKATDQKAWLSLKDSSGGDVQFAVIPANDGKVESVANSSPVRRADP